MHEHPEQKKDEVFYANMCCPEFEDLNLTTKRKGKKPLPIFGENFKNFSSTKKPFPVFIKQWEYDKKILLRKNCQKPNGNGIFKKIYNILKMPIFRQK